MGSAYNNPAQFFQQLSGFIQGEVAQGVSRKAKEMRELSGLTEGGAFAGGTIERKKGGRNVNAVSSGPERVARRARARQAIIERNRERKAARAEGRETTPDESPRLEDKAPASRPPFLVERPKPGDLVRRPPEEMIGDTGIIIPDHLTPEQKAQMQEDINRSLAMPGTPVQPRAPEPSGQMIGDTGVIIPDHLTPEQKAQMEQDVNRSLAAPKPSHYRGSPIGPQRSGPPLDDEARRQEQMAIDIARGQEANRQEGANRIAVGPYLRRYEGISDAEMDQRRADQMALDISRSQTMPYNDQDPGARDVEVLLRQLGELGVEQGINSGLPPAPNDAVRAPTGDYQYMGPFPEDYYFQRGTAPPLDLPFGSNIDRIMMPPRLPDIPRSPSEAYFDPRDARRRLIDMPGGRPDIPPMFLPPTGPVLMPARY